MVAKPARRASDPPVVFELRRLVSGLPAPPPASLDPLLDAAARCFARHGVRRTSVQDVAQELRVNRTTVYRQVGNVETIARLLMARELHRMLGSLPELWQQRSGPEAIVEVMSAVIEFARSHPVTVKLINDEPELIGPVLVSDLPDVLGRVAAATVPMLQAAMDSGELAPRDPVVVAEWLVRLGMSLVLAPPPGDTASFLAELLVPALTPRKETP